VQHAVNDDRAFFHFEVKPMFLRTKPVHDMTVALDSSEAITSSAIEVLFGHMEFLQQLKLLQRAQCGNLRRADFIENDLKHPVTLNHSYGTSTLRMRMRWNHDPNGKRSMRAHLPDGPMAVQHAG
jgi:hypothetical protein